MTTTQTPEFTDRISEQFRLDQEQQAAWAEAEAVIREQHPKAFRCRDDKNKAQLALIKKTANLRKQIKDCQESLLRVEEEIEERSDMLAEMDMLIDEAISQRMLADEMRPHVRAELEKLAKEIERVAQIEDNRPELPEKSPELIRLQEQLERLDAGASGLSTRIAKIYYNR